MKIGIIGSGRVGCSMGKYLTDHKIEVVGFYNRHYQGAKEASEFTGTDSFHTMEELVQVSDTLFITTPDDEISKVWDCMREMSINQKIICHFSGSLSSALFQGIEATGAYGCSIHPLLAFSSKFSAYKQLNQGYLSMEGNEVAVAGMKRLFEDLGNHVILMDSSKKTAYHAAASVLSNHIVGVLDAGYSIMQQCGFTYDEARRATEALVRNNVETVIAEGCASALTGPIERNDVHTVEGHLKNLSDALLYQYIANAKRILDIARQKNPQVDYSKMSQLFIESEKECRI